MNLILTVVLLLAGLELRLDAQTPASVSFLETRRHYAVDAFSAGFGDFNSDGKRDIAYCTRNGSYFALQLGNGDGTFQPELRVGVPAYETFYLVVADFNSDGKVDVAVTHGIEPSLSVHLGRGDGTFSSPTVLNVGFTTAIATGDINGDARPDLVLAIRPYLTDTRDGVLVLLNAGGGTFGAPLYTQVSLNAAATGQFVLADFNTDGKLDLAINRSVNYTGEDTLAILAGTGTGTFGPPAYIDLIDYAVKLFTGDMDQDGKMDLVALTSNTSGIPGPTLGPAFLAVLFGNGNGSFGIPRYYKDVYLATLGDVDADGDLDGLTGSAQIYLNNGRGRLEKGAQLVGLSGQPYLVNLRNNGKLDLVFTTYKEPAVVLNKGGGAFENGLFAQPDTYGGSPLTTADFNGDGKPDLARIEEASVRILQGTQQLSTPFVETQSVALSSRGFAILANDFDRDGRADLLVQLDYVVVFLRNLGGGTFGEIKTSTAAGYLSGLSAADIDRDGKLDLMTFYFSSTAYQYVLSLQIGNGDGSFQSPKYIYTSGKNSGGATLADMNADGKTDVITTTYRADVARDLLTVLLGNGNGTFQAPLVFDFGYGTALGGLASDLNGDGRLDLAGTSGSDVNIFFGNGDGTVQAPVPYRLSSPGSVASTRDLNADGKPDLTVAQEYAVSILLGRGDGTFIAPILFGKSSATGAFAFGEFYHSGGPPRMDFVIGTAGLSFFVNTTP